MNNAMMLLKGLRFHHLGFCFFWAVIFVVLSGLQSTSNPSDHWRLYLLVEQTVTTLAVGLVVYLYWRKKTVLPRWLSLVAGFTLSGGALLYFMAFAFGFDDVVTAGISGVMLGCANALFFLLWQTFFVTEGQQRSIIYIPISAVLSIVLYIVTQLLPFLALLFVVVVVLPFLAMLTLHTSLGEIELYPIRVLDKIDLKRVVADLWKPIFCVCAIGFVWKLVSRLSGSVESSEGFTAMAVLVGFGAASLLVALIELFSKKGFEILRMYQILFPIITGIFLLPTFFGSYYSPLLTGMLMFGFETVNLLLLVACAVYSAQKRYSPIVMYGICIFPVLFFMVAGDALGSVLTPILAFDFAHVINALFVCVYLLSVVLVLVSRGRKPAPVIAGTEYLALDDDTLISDSIEAAAYVPAGITDQQAQVGQDEEAELSTVQYFLQKGLSRREIEVAELLTKGHSVAAIAKKLYISENTTRGHTKSIYRRLGVHSRQELIDMREQGIF